ncbi:MAG: hypothetical protein IJZ00_00530 [Lachnospiraceae bacterium]|nr:hypothetical protein [Lachnospiraceae bacterium]
MRKENIVLILWDECKNVFSSSNNKQLKVWLQQLLEIIKKYYDFFYEKVDLEFLKFVVKISVDDYFVGTNGDDFELRAKSYIQQEIISIEDIWVILSQLIWDLTVPVTNKVCPFCQCDNLVLLTDKNEKWIYEFCENCFWTSKDEIQIMRPDSLFPASKKLLEMNDYRL